MELLYQTLDASSPQIRLWSLHPGSGSIADLILCSLTTHSLDDKNLRYEALLYVWETPLLWNPYMSMDLKYQ